MLKSLIIRGSFDDMEEVVRIAKTEGRKILRVENKSISVVYLSPIFYQNEIIWIAVISDNGVTGCRTPLVVGDKNGEKEKE